MKEMLCVCWDGCGWTSCERTRVCVGIGVIHVLLYVYLQFSCRNIQTFMSCFTSNLRFNL